METDVSPTNRGRGADSPWRPGVRSRPVPQVPGDEDVDSWGVDSTPLNDDSFSYALGAQGSTRRKRAAAAGCIIEYVGRLACFAGYKQDRRRGKDYLRWLLEQRTGSSNVENPKERDDCTMVKVPATSVAFITGHRGESLRQIERESSTFCFSDGDRNDRSKPFENLLIFSFSRSAREHARRRCPFLFERRAPGRQFGATWIFRGGGAAASPRPPRGRASVALGMARPRPAPRNIHAAPRGGAATRPSEYRRGTPAPRNIHAAPRGGAATRPSCGAPRRGRRRSRHTPRRRPRSSRTASRSTSASATARPRWAAAAAAATAARGGVVLFLFDGDPVDRRTFFDVAPFDVAPFDTASIDAARHDPADRRPLVDLYSVSRDPRDGATSGHDERATTTFRPVPSICSGPPRTRDARGRRGLDDLRSSSAPVRT